MKLMLSLVLILCLQVCHGMHRMKLFKRHTRNLSLNEKIQRVKTSRTNIALNLPLKNNVNVDYYGSISLGEGPRAKCFPVFFDTASSFSWFAGTDNIVAADTNHQVFNCNKSSTCTPSGNFYDWQYSYGQGKAELVHETFCFGCGADGLCVKDQAILVSTQNNDSFLPSTYPFEHYPYDAMVGLGYDSSAINGTTTPFFGLLSNNSCKEGVFGLWINRDQTSEDGGEMTICGTDPNHYISPLVWTPVTENKYWQFTADSISVGGKVITSKFKTIISTKEQGIVGPLKDILGIYKELGIPYDDDWNSGIINCTNVEEMHLPNLTISIDGAQFTIISQDYLYNFPSTDQCQVLIGGSQDTSQPDLWYFGSSFLKAAYTVFDVANNRIGFSESKSDPGSETVPPISTISPSAGARSFSNAGTIIATCLLALIVSQMITVKL